MKGGFLMSKKVLVIKSKSVGKKTPIGILKRCVNVCPGRPTKG